MWRAPVGIVPVSGGHLFGIVPVYLAGTCWDCAGLWRALAGIVPIYLAGSCWDCADIWRALVRTVPVYLAGTCWYCADVADMQLLGLC